MGRKLTSYERRERERKREEEKVKKASLRENEKKEKEKEKELQRKLGSKYAELFQYLLQGLGNLTSDDVVKKVSAKNSLENISINSLDLPMAINFKYPGDLSYSGKQKLKVNNFIPNKSLTELEKNINLSYEEYKSLFGSFLGNIFGKTKREYEQFITDSKRELNDLTQKDEKRKQEFKLALEEYEQAVEDFDKKVAEKIENDNLIRKKQFDELTSEVEAFNKSLKALKEEVSEALGLIKKEPASFKEQDFVQLFGLSLPIHFQKLDEAAAILKAEIKELDKNFYDSPSKNFKYGLDVSGEFLTLFITFKEEYFPLPTEQMVDSVKSGYSVKSATKSDKQYIEKNMAPSAALVYAGYAFNSLNTISNVKVVVGKEAIDGKTGSTILEWIYNLTIDRSTFSKLNFDKITPSETIDIFKTNEVAEIRENINWFLKKRKGEQLILKQRKITKRHYELKEQIENFKQAEFVPPSEKKEMERDKERLDEIMNIKI